MTAPGAVAPVKSKADWQQRRAEILRGMTEVMGPLPGREKRCPLDLQIEQETDCGSYVRRSITYAAEPGSRVPGLSALPKAALRANEKLPAVLALHPTDMEYGHRVVAEQLRANYRAYGSDLAERGYVVLAPVLSHNGRLPARPQSPRLPKRHHESHLGQHPRAGLARVAALRPQEEVRRHRPFTGRPQRHLHRRL